MTGCLTLNLDVSCVCVIMWKIGMCGLHYAKEGVVYTGIAEGQYEPKLNVFPKRNSITSKNLAQLCFSLLSLTRTHTHTQMHSLFLYPITVCVTTAVWRITSHLQPQTCRHIPLKRHRGERQRDRQREREIERERERETHRKTVCHPTQDEPGNVLVVYNSYKMRIHWVAMLACGLSTNWVRTVEQLKNLVLNVCLLSVE